MVTNIELKYCRKFQSQKNFKKYFRFLKMDKNKCPKLKNQKKF